MSLSSVVFAWMVLNGYNFFVSIVVTLLLGIRDGLPQWYPGHEAADHASDRNPGHAEPVQRRSPVDRAGRLSAIKSSPGVAMAGWINDYARKEVFLGLPWAFWVAIFMVALLIVLQRKTLLGKYAAAIGGNRLAAELSGINAVRVVWLIYIIVGFFAALAGVARASYMSLGDPLSGDGMELACIIAVLLGGTAFSGGEGSVAKTMIGAIIIMCVTTGLMTVIPAYWQICRQGHRAHHRRCSQSSACAGEGKSIEADVPLDQNLERYAMFKMPVGLYEKALPASMCWEERLTAAGQAGYDFVEISIDESDERLVGWIGDLAASRTAPCPSPTVVSRS